MLRSSPPGPSARLTALVYSAAAVFHRLRLCQSITGVWPLLQIVKQQSAQTMKRLAPMGGGRAARLPAPLEPPFAHYTLLQHDRVTDYSHGYN